MARRITDTQLEADLWADPDGLAVRRIGIWSLEKLAVVRLYTEGFTGACKEARESYYVDGFSGPGLSRVRVPMASGDLHVWGSPLIALRTRPQFTRCVLLELDIQSCDALRSRTAPYSDRAAIIRGDVNRDLVPAVREHVPAWACSGSVPGSV